MGRLWVLLVGLASFCLVVRACPSGWNAHDGSCHRFMGVAKSWNAAKSSCQSLDQHGKLAEIGDQAEQTFLENLLKQHGVSAAWIGVTDSGHEGQWKFASSGHTPPYTHWGPNEPSNTDDEDCAAIDMSRFQGKWDDQDCASRDHPYVCEVVGQVTGGGATTPPVNKDNLPFYNTKLDWNTRVDDLVSRLTLQEVQDQLTNGGGGPPAPAIPRLGIQPYQWWSNCGRGAVGLPGDATAYPQTIGLAASFDPQLTFRVAEAGGTELRAKHKVFMNNHQYGTHMGLSCFSPDLDIMKHPNWGRNQETHGEDPYMARRYADYFIRGLQGDHPRYIRASAGCKHFGVHSGPESGRAGFDSKASMEDMRMTYLPGFRQCAESGAYAYMTSYNAINGVPVAANHWLLTEVTRDEWKFKGYMLADAGAVESIVHAHHYTNSAEDTVAACLNAGLNIEVAGGSTDRYYKRMIDAIHHGKTTEKIARDLLKPLFYTRMRLGEFDPPAGNPYMQLDMSVVESQAHQDLAVEAAMKSFVLLKNNGVLPLKNQHYNNVALVGPFSDETSNLFGDYTANTNSKYKSNVMDAVNFFSAHVHHGDGCSDPGCDHYNAGQVTSQLQGVDLIFVALGTGQAGEREGHDKKTYSLPGHQKQLLQDVLSHAGSTPVILLLFTGSAIDISFAESDHRVSAILECFLPAQATGVALRHVLLNDVAGAVPAGRLPFTWYKSEHDIGSISDYSMKGKTYRYLHAGTEPLYPFGYGLSYTSFHYTGLTAPHSVQAGHDLTGTVTVHNTGNHDADEAVQIYIKWEKASLPAPNLQLAWFDRVRVAKGGSSTVHFKVEAKTMALWINNKWEIPAGPMKLYAGGQQPNQQKSLSSNVLSVDFDIQGTQHPGSLIG